MGGRRGVVEFVLENVRESVVWRGVTRDMIGLLVLDLDFIPLWVFGGIV